MAETVDLYIVYQFIKRLSTPFEDTDAFKLGLIDKDGKRLKKAKSSEEKKAMTYFDRLIFNVKRLLAKVPGGSSRFASYAAAMLLLKECANPKEHYSDEELAEKLMENMEMLEKTSTKKLNELFEDAPANATGAAVAGTGDTGDAWKMDARNKKTKAFLRRYIEQKGKREAVKKRKDFMKQLGITV
jgi:hypothetical protein